MVPIKQRIWPPSSPDESAIRITFPIDKARSINILGENCSDSIALSTLQISLSPTLVNTKPSAATCPKRDSSELVAHTTKSGWWNLPVMPWPNSSGLREDLSSELDNRIESNPVPENDTLKSKESAARLASIDLWTSSLKDGAKQPIQANTLVHTLMRNKQRNFVTSTMYSSRWVLHASRPLIVMD